jgi:hypothetical protein
MAPRECDRPQTIDHIQAASVGLYIRLVAEARRLAPRDGGYYYAPPMPLEQLIKAEQHEPRLVASA